MSARFDLVLVRHGLTDWNEQGKLLGRIDVELNERGRAQARLAAEALGTPPVEAVVSSPQPRTRQTAEPIAEAHGLEVEIDPDLDEVWLSERWQGRTVQELRGNGDLDRLIADPTHRSDSIEAIEDVMMRSVRATERLARRHPGGRVIVVSHGDPLRTIVLHHMGLGMRALRKISIDNGSITVIHFGARGSRLAVLNWTPSLPA